MGLPQSSDLSGLDNLSGLDDLSGSRLYEPYLPPLPSSHPFLSKEYSSRQVQYTQNQDRRKMVIIKSNPPPKQPETTTNHRPSACSLYSCSSHVNTNFDFPPLPPLSLPPSSPIKYNSNSYQYNPCDRTLDDFLHAAKKAVRTADKIADATLTIKKVVRYALALGGITTITTGSVSYPLYSFFQKNNNNNTELRCSESRETIEGKFCRVKRWKESIESTEVTYKIPHGLLAGIAMAESYGDPTETNKDGSAGLFQLEPSIAEKYGLSIYHHGNNPKKSLQHLMSTNKPIVETLQAYDERFNVKQATETAGHYLDDLHSTFVQKQTSNRHLKSHDAWELAAAAYAVGISSADAHLDSHKTYIELVKAYQRYYISKIL